MLFPPNKRARVNVEHGPRKIPSISATKGPAAFRPTTARGLALSDFFPNLPFAYDYAKAVPCSKHDDLSYNVLFFQGIRKNRLPDQKYDHRWVDVPIW